MTTVPFNGIVRHWEDYLKVRTNKRPSPVCDLERTSLREAGKVCCCHVTEIALEGCLDYHFLCGGMNGAQSAEQFRTIVLWYN